MVQTGRIFCIMGKSGTGKDTVLQNLVNDRELNLKTVIPYTTRPKRTYEVQGREYYFISDEELNKFDLSGKIIEIRKYNTIKGIWSYATIDDGQLDLEHHNYVLIGTLDVFESLNNYFGADRIFPLMLVCEDGIRLERALRRERTQDKPDYEELCRRFLADNKDFSPEKLKVAGIRSFYDNYDLQQCLLNIKSDLKILI